jgi:predicted transcriptional regulator
MAMVRTNITIPEDLLAQVDEYAGPRGRSAYVVEAIERRVKRDRLRKALDESWAVTAGTPEWRSPEEILAWANDVREQDRPDPWEESRRLAEKEGRRQP